MTIKKLLVSVALVGGVFGSSGCGDNSPKVGILLPVQHVALQKASDGFKKAFEEAGLKVSFVENNAGGNDADLQSYAKSLVNKCSLTLGVGTGAALALKAAQTVAGTLNPILFTAVTDASVLLDNQNEPEGFITGTSDMNPVAEQVALIKECIPSSDKMGIIYTQSEVNSQVQANQAKVAAEAAGLSVTIQTCTNSSDIKAAAENLSSIEGIDAIYIPTDNNIAANMNAIKTACFEKHILMVSGEEGMMEYGAHVTLSISYEELGKKTGEMAVKLLKNEKQVKDFSVLHMTAAECEYVYSSKNLSDAGITLPSEVLTSHNWRNVGE